MSAVVAPLYTAPFGEPLPELSTSRTTLIEGGLPPAGILSIGFQPEIVPSSVAKMKTAGLPGGVPLSRIKSLGLPLKTMPVGVAAAPGVKPGGGTITKLSNVLLGGSGKLLVGTASPLLLMT